MTNDETTLDENEQSTLDENAESEDTSDDLNDIFSDLDEDAEDVGTLKEKIARLEKGIQKLATQKGQEKKEVKEKVVEKKTESSISPVLKNLYIKSNPEAALVWDEVEKEAKNLGKDPFELYESSSYFKGEAKSLYDAQTESEANKAKIDKPSGYTGGSKKFDPSKVKAEDVVNLKPHEKMEWLRLQAENERNRDE